MPSAAEIDVEEWAAPNGSYSLSARLVKPGQAATLTQRANAVAPTSEDFVRIGLVADIPDQPVGWRVEHVVQRYRQLDHAESCAEMTAGLGDCVNGLGTQLVGKLLELLGRQVFEIARKVDAVEQRCLGRLRTRATPNKPDQRRRVPAPKLGGRD